MGKGEIVHNEQFLLFPQKKKLLLQTRKTQGLFGKGFTGSTSYLEFRYLEEGGVSLENTCSCFTNQPWVLIIKMILRWPFRSWDKNFTKILQYYVKCEKCKVNDVIFPSVCEAHAINLSNKNMKI